MTEKTSAAGPTDPVAALGRAYGTPVRVAALILAIAAQFVPALSNSFDAFGVGMLSQVAPLALAFPVVIAVVCLLPAIPAAAAYTRIGDIVAAATGAVSLAAVVAFYGSVQAYADKTNGDAYRKMGGTMMAISPGLGSYLLGAATLALVFLAVRPSRSMIDEATAPGTGAVGRTSVWFGAAGGAFVLASIIVPILPFVWSAIAAVLGGLGFRAGRREGNRAGTILGIVVAALGVLLLVVLIARKVIWNL